MEPGEKIRVAAVGDVHCGVASAGKLRRLFGTIDREADFLLLCGDLTDYGLPEEAAILSEELSVLEIPVVAVLGNHDYESGQQDAVRRVLRAAGVQVLDGEAYVNGDLGVAGIKGFAGGFGRGALGAWGEKTIKDFVNEAIQEELKLESALAKLNTRYRIALLHYAPIAATCQGEPPEIFPFLGSSRLEDPLIHSPVDVVFHGHAHHGSPEGKTMNNTPVYNVAKPLLQHSFPDQPPFRIVELPLA